jgi:hypothetical protein
MNANGVLNRAGFFAPGSDDEPIIACALAGGDGVFVTGDKALLDMPGIGGMSNMGPRGLWERLAGRV